MPGATLVADFSELDIAANTFDAVTALYSIMHVPRDEHPALFGRIARWLKPGGLFLASLSHVGGPDWTGEWLGVEMFFSAFDAETNRRLVREAGFELILDELVRMREPRVRWRSSGCSRGDDVRRFDATRVFYGMEFFDTLGAQAAFTVWAVYLVQDVGVNPLQLVLLGR